MDNFDNCLGGEAEARTKTEHVGNEFPSYDDNQVRRKVVTWDLLVFGQVTIIQGSKP